MAGAANEAKLVFFIGIYETGVGQGPPDLITYVNQKGMIKGTLEALKRISAASIEFKPTGSQEVYCVDWSVFRVFVHFKKGGELVFVVATSTETNKSIPLSALHELNDDGSNMQKVFKQYNKFTHARLYLGKNSYNPPFLMPVENAEKVERYFASTIVPHEEDFEHIENEEERISTPRGSRKGSRGGSDRQFLPFDPPNMRIDLSRLRAKRNFQEFGDEGVEMHVLRDDSDEDLRFAEEGEEDPLDYPQETSRAHKMKMVTQFIYQDLLDDSEEKNRKKTCWQRSFLCCTCISCAGAGWVALACCCCLALIILTFLVVLFGILLGLRLQ